MGDCQEGRMQLHPPKLPKQELESPVKDRKRERKEKQGEERGENTNYNLISRKFKNADQEISFYN